MAQKRNNNWRRVGLLFMVYSLWSMVIYFLFVGVGWAADIEWYAENIDGNSSLDPGTTTQINLKLKAVNTSISPYLIQKTTFTYCGNPDDAPHIATNSVKLWTDDDGDWATRGDRFQEGGDQSFDGGSPAKVLFSFSKGLSAGATIHFFLTYDLKNFPVTEGHTIDTQIEQNTDIQMNGGTLGGVFPLNSSGTPSYDTIDVNATKYEIDAIGTQLAGKPFEVKVSVVDAYSNVDLNYSGAIVNITGASSFEPGIAPDGTTPLYPAPYTWQGIVDGGTKTFEVILYKAELNRKLKIDDGVIPDEESNPFNVDPGFVFDISIPQSAVIGEGIDIGIRVDEPYGNDFPYNSTVRFSSSDGRAVLPENYTFIHPERNKIFSKGIIFKTQGTQTITLTDNSNSKINALKSVLVQPENVGYRPMNYPNPFDPTKEKTTLQFYMQDAGKAEIKIYAAPSGELVNEWEIEGSKGINTSQWDGRDKDRDIVPNGMYLCLIRANDKKEVITIVAVK